VIVEHWRERLLGDSLEQSLLVIEFWASACRDPEIHRRFSDQHERVMSGVAMHLEQAAERLGVTLPLPARELVRLTTGIAHGLALEQLMNRDRVDVRMIDLAFMAIREFSVPGGSAALQVAGADRHGKRGKNVAGAPRRAVGRG
jgi:hypothetical protein